MDSIRAARGPARGTCTTNCASLGDRMCFIWDLFRLRQRDQRLLEQPVALD